MQRFEVRCGLYDC